MTTINVKGSIINSGTSWLYDWLGIPYTSPEQFKAQLAAADDDVIVEINSPGGYVAPAAEIYEAIRSYGGNIECKVVGQAASAASIIAVAAKNSITPMGTLFLHNCIGYAEGNHNAMRQSAQMMESVDENIMEAYRIKTGMDDAEIYEIMENNTTLSARRAVELGFIDRISESAADIAQASSAVTGIAASAGGFIDLMSIDADRLAALRDAYEASMHAIDGEGGEEMEDEEIIEEPEEAVEDQEEPEECEPTEGEGDSEAGSEESEEPEAGDDSEDLEEPEDAQAAYDRGVLAERERIAGIMDIAAQVPDAMVRAALFAEPISAEQLALQAMLADDAQRTGYIENARADAEASGSAQVAADVTDAPAIDSKDEQKRMLEDELTKRFSTK